MRNRAVPALLAVLLAASVGACSTTDFSTDDALSAVGTALDVANVALAVSGGNTARGGATPPAPRGGYVPPAGNGYSQKGAFDDCARLYGSAGMEAQARECRKRSANMGSLR